MRSRTRGASAFDVFIYAAVVLAIIAFVWASFRGEDWCRQYCLRQGAKYFTYNVKAGCTCVGETGATP